LQLIALLLTAKNTSSAVKHVLRAIGEREKNNAQRRDRFLENDLKGRRASRGRGFALSDGQHWQHVRINLSLSVHSLEV